MANENMYDHLPALEAVIQAWSKPGRAPGYHARMQSEVRHISPLLWFAVRRAVAENGGGLFAPRHGEDTPEHLELLQMDTATSLLAAWRGSASGPGSLTQQALGNRVAVRHAMPLLGRALDRLTREAREELKASQRAQWDGFPSPSRDMQAAQRISARAVEDLKAAGEAKPESPAKMWAKNLWWWIPVAVAAGAVGGLISRGF